MNKLKIALLTGACLLSGTAFAQTYPNKAITMIVPFAAGGPTDVVARVIGEPMSRILGQQVVIEMSPALAAPPASPAAQTPRLMATPS